MKEQNNPYFEEDFKEVGGTPEAFKRSKDKQPLADIRLRFKVAKRQPASEGGLAFSIILANEAAGDLTVSNPLDTLQLLLLDEEGWPVKLPAGGPPRALINTRGDVPVDIVRPFKVEAIENSLKEPGLMKGLTDEKFLLKKKVSYEFRIKIPTVQESDKKALHMQMNTSKTKPIGKGKYKIKILFQLLLSNDSPVHRQCESGYMDIELV